MDKPKSQIARRATAIDENIASLVESTRIIAENLQRIAHAYESAAAYMADSSGHLTGAATNIYDVSQIYRGSKEKLVDAASKLNKIATTIYEDKKEELGIPPKSEMH